MGWGWWEKVRVGSRHKGCSRCWHVHKGIAVVQLCLHLLHPTRSLALTAPPLPQRASFCANDAERRRRPPENKSWRGLGCTRMQSLQGARPRARLRVRCCHVQARR